MIPTGCPDCNRLVGVVCPAHCLGEHCLNGVHVDRCTGPDRNRQLELLHRHGYPITPAIVTAVLNVERTVRRVLADAGLATT